MNTAQLSLQTTKSRLNWIDVAKGLCLFLVVFGHLLPLTTWPNLRIAIYSFHMPMYFILSGWVLKPKDQKFFAFVKEKFFRLLLPAIIYLLICLPVAVKFQIEDGATTNQILSKAFFFKGTLLLNDPIWFLIVMFEVVVFARLIHLEKYQTWAKFLTAFVCFGLALVFYYVYNIPYFGLNRAVLCLGFYALGGGFSNIYSKIKSRDLIDLISFGATLLWLLFSSFIKKSPSLYAFYFYNLFYLLGASICGSIMWFRISSLLSNCQPLVKLGQNTLVVLGTQYYWIYFLTRYAKPLHIYKNLYGNLIAVFSTLLFMLIYYFLSEPINKYLPFLNGRPFKKRTKK